MSSPTAQTESPINAMSPMPLPYAVLQVQGEDARSFLQSQFTNSVEQLTPVSDGPAQHQRNGYCSAKGRLLAICRCWQLDATTYRLLVPADIAEPLVKRLRMFVLRAKLTIERTAALVCGLRSPASAQTLAVEQPMAGMTCLVQPAASPGAEATLRWLVVDAPELAAPDSLRTALPDQQLLSPTDWQWHQTALAEPWIWAATQDRFVPQAINFELLGGVDFQKGCYPGQEVVARSQYLGKLKTRLFVMSADQDPSTCPLGSDVWLDAQAPVGELVQAAAGQDGRPHLVLVSLDLEAWKAVTQGQGQGVLKLGATLEQGLTLRPMDQPYSVPLEPNQPVRPKLR